jgi:hypothetical protein
MTKPENLPNHIATLSCGDWQQLFDLLPEIKSSARFGRLVGSKCMADGSVSYPYWSEEAIVSRFFNTSYFLGLVVLFDWAAWDEGLVILNNPSSNFLQFDLMTLIKLLTVIIRSDKYCEGYMINSFENGTVIRILEAMQTKIAE